MARMVPDPMRPTESAAEALLYRKFRDDLPDRVVVVHGARWVGRRHGREGADGEADFVVLDPERGILVLEAKSGELRLDGERGTWVQRVGGREHAVDPVGQALVSKYRLHELLRAIPGVASRRHHVVHGVAIPFHVVPAEGLGLDLPRERVLDAHALQDVARAVARALASAEETGLDRPPLGADGVARVVEALAPRRDVPLHLPSVAGDVRERLVRLTDEQLEALSWLPSVPRALVAGGPGTGKTVLAQELARRLAVSGLRVLLLCFNGPLAGRLEASACATPGLEATTFHELCRRQGRAAGLSARVEAASKDPAGFEHVLPELLLEASGVVADRYDAIVVDEAQDFLPHWWVPLEAWLDGGREGRVYAFADASQDVYGRGAGVPAADLRLVGPVVLRKNCRNAAEVCDVLAALVPDGNLLSSGVAAGRRPRLTWVADRSHVAAATARAVERLLAGGLAPSEVVVLTPRSKGRSALADVERFGRAPAAWKERPTPGHVLVDTVHRFKGLESTAVVLTEVDPEEVPHLERLLWVGVSRATALLEVVATTAARAVLRGAARAFDEEAPRG